MSVEKRLLSQIERVCRDLRACGLSTDHDAIVDSLRDRFPECKRLKVQVMDPFIRQVLEKDSESTEAPKADPVNHVLKTLPATSRTLNEASDDSDVEMDVKSKFQLESVSLRFSDCPGTSKLVIQDLMLSLVLPMKSPQRYIELMDSMSKGRGERSASSCTGTTGSYISGSIISGPPGVGKSRLAIAAIGECGASMIRVNASDLMAGVIGESEKIVKRIFQLAKEGQIEGKSLSESSSNPDSHTTASPSRTVILIDDIDLICSDGDMQRRILTQLCSEIDRLSEGSGNRDGRSNDLAVSDISGSASSFFLGVLATTSRPESLSGAIRRSGRFDSELTLNFPDLSQRREILSYLLNEGLGSGEVLEQLATKTPGFTASDLSRIAKLASSLLLEKESKASIDLTMQERNSGAEEISQSHPSWSRPSEALVSEVFAAASQIVPTAKREGFSLLPNVNFSDIGALQSAKSVLEREIILPIKHRHIFKSLVLNREVIGGLGAGVLLCGPPGCGKTMLAKAVATASGASFIAVKGPELMNMYFGESEKAIRSLFARAASCSPCVIFFDELDSLAPRRDGSSSGSGSGGSNGSGGGGSSGAASSSSAVCDRIVNQLLVEMDGVASSGNAAGGSSSVRDIYVLGATNRPDKIDPAILRPGRLGTVLYVNLPDEHDRFDILAKLVKATRTDSSVDSVLLKKIAHSSARFTGADLAAVVKLSVSIAVHRIDKQLTSSAAQSESSSQMLDSVDEVQVFVTASDLLSAASSIQPSVSPAEEDSYRAMHRS